MPSYQASIVAARLAREWSREDLAEETGLPLSDIIAIETGRAEPTPVLDALELIQLNLILPEVSARFLQAILSEIRKVEPERLLILLAEILDAIGQERAGNPNQRRQINVVHGDSVNVEQRNA